MKTDSDSWVVGVDLGGTKVLAAAVAPGGEVVARAKTRTRVELGVSEVLERIVDVVGQAIDAAQALGFKRSNLLAIGVGAPGPLNPDTGVLESPPNMTGWVNVPLKTVLERQLGARVFVENDVNVGTLGESRRGAGVGVRDLMGIFIGTGIGGGLILNGQLYQGFTKTAGEVGHVTIDLNGPECPCGKRGCLETLAARPAVVRRIAALACEEGRQSPILDEVGGDASKVRSGLLARGWRDNDPCVRQALEEMARYVGIAIGSLMNLLNPEMFVLGGGVVEALGSEIVDSISATARDHAFPNASKNVRVVAAMLGDDSGVLGAAMLARERMAERSRQ